MKACNAVHIRGFGMGDGIAHRSTLNILNPCNDKAHFARLQNARLKAFGRKDTDGRHQMSLACGLNKNLIACLDLPFTHPHQGHHAQIIIKPRINNQGL